MNKNVKIISYEKNLKNRINKKFNKMIDKLDKNKLSFCSLNDEIKFLNQLYFLNNSIENLENNLNNMNLILNNMQKKEKISIDFNKQISDDKWEKEIMGKLASLVFL